MNRFQGKIAFVTSASGGVGKGVVTKFAEEGAKIRLVDIEEVVSA